MKSSNQLKQETADYAYNLIRDKNIILIGSGSTVNKVTQQLTPQTRVVSASRASSELIRENGLDEMTLDYVMKFDERICIDGADQVILPQKLIVKGHGGALLREKIVWQAATKILVLVDESKLADTLTKTIPVVISPFSPNMIQEEILKLDGIMKSTLFSNNGLPFTTDDGMMIVHLDVKPDTELIKLDQKLHLIPGVLDTGIFLPTQFKEISIICASQEKIEIY